VTDTDTRSEKLTPEARQAAVDGLKHWRGVKGRNAIRRRFQLRNFDDAWALMNTVADVARKLDHHPELLNLYSRVEITLWTYECGGLTAHDIALAHAIDAAVDALSQTNTD